jgi:hypothetical protein
MDLSGPLAALQENKLQLTEKWFEDNWRLIIPSMEGFSISGLDIDMPDEEHTGQRIAALTEGFDVSLANYVNGIPTSIKMSADGYKMAIPEGEGAAALKSLGVETVDLSYDITLNWDPSTRNIHVENFEFSGADLGRVRLTGTIGNAGEELFAPNIEAAAVAALALTVKDVTIDVENDGLAPMLISSVAAEQKMKPEAFHAVLLGMAKALPIAMLGGTPDSVTLSQALAAFLAGTPNLSVKLSAVDPNGISIPMFMLAQQNPALLKDRIAIDAAATGDASPYKFVDLAEKVPAAAGMPPAPPPADPVPAPVPAPPTKASPPPPPAA